MYNGMVSGDFKDKVSENVLRYFQNLAKKHKILALGETVHTSGGYYDVKIAILKNLISLRCIEAIAFENPWSDTKIINDFINGKDVSIAHAVKQLFIVWRSKSVANFIEWLRDFNLKLPQEERVYFFGFDIQNPQFSLELIHEFVEQNKNQELNFNEKSLFLKNNENKIAGWRDIKKLFDQNQNKLLLNDFISILKQIEILEKKSRRLKVQNKELELALTTLSYYIKFTYYFAKEASEKDISIPSSKKPIPTEGFNFRDQGMFEIFNIYFHSLGQPNTFLWAHNLHIVMKGENISTWKKTSLGSHLNTKFGDEYCPVALAGYYIKTNWPDAPGNMDPPLPHPEDSIEQTLYLKNLDQCYIDLENTNLFSEKASYVLNPVLKMEKISQHFKGILYIKESLGMEIFEEDSLSMKASY